MAYTPSPLRAKSGATFNGLVDDGNRNAMQFGNSMQTQDGTASPVKSPLAMTGSVQTITVPPNAIQMIINPTTTTVNVSEDSTMSVYFTIPIGNSQKIDVARQTFMYLQGTSPNVVNFYFNTV